MVLLQRKLYFSDPEGVQHFPVGAGIQILISIEPHITCNFPGGGGEGGPDHMSPYRSAQKHRGSNTDRNRSLNMRTD